MAAFGDIDTGAARPPLLFGLALRLFCAGLLMLAFGAAAAVAAECRYIRGGPLQIEGFDGPDPFGFQLITRDMRWTWGPAAAGNMAFCPLCLASDIGKAVLRMGQAPFLNPIQVSDLRSETGQQSASPVEFALHPRVISVALWRITALPPPRVEPLTDITPVTLWNVPAMARVVEISSADRTVSGLAIAIEDRCFAVFGVFFRKDDGEVSVDDVPKVNAALGMVKYQPERHRLSPAIEFPLGDQRKQWEEDQK